MCLSRVICGVIFVLGTGKEFEEKRQEKDCDKSGT